MKKNYREVLFFDAKFVTSSRAFKAPRQISANTLINHLESLDLDNTRYSLFGGAEVYYISDWKRISPTKVYFLVNKSDKSLSDPTFSNVEAGTRRRIFKKTGEGQDLSSHVVLRTDYFSGDTDPRALLLLERSSINPTNLTNFLNFLLKQAKAINKENYLQNHPDGEIVKGNAKQYSVSSRVTLNGHLCENFLDSLDSGKIQGIELITKEKTKSAIDQDEFLEEKRTIVEVKVKETFAKSLAIGFRDFVREKRANNKFSHMRIRFKDNKDVPHAETIDLDNPQIEDYYVKKERISDVENLESSYNEINMLLVEKMESFL